MANAPRDLESLEKAVNAAASKAAASWLSFISFATLLMITTGTVTHTQLLFSKPLRLPLVNAELPLSGYFFFAPLFFVIFHFYTMLQIHDLSTKVRAYVRELEEQFP